MKPSDIFIIIMISLIVFFSGDLLYIVVISAFARIGYMRLLEEEAKPNGLFSLPEKTEDMRDGVKEE